MQSFFKSFMAPPEPPQDASEYSESESEASVEVLVETKKTLAGGDELLHYEAPKPWTIRKPIYDKPLPAPKFTPQLGTEDRMGSPFQTMERVPEMHSPGIQGRRDSLKQSRSPESSFVEIPLETRAEKTASEVKKEHDPSTPAVTALSQTKSTAESVDPSIQQKSLGAKSLVQTPEALEAKASADSVDKKVSGDSAGFKAVEFFETRVSDTHFSRELTMDEILAYRNLGIQGSFRGTLGQKPIEADKQKFPSDSEFSSGFDTFQAEDADVADYSGEHVDDARIDLTKSTQSGDIDLDKGKTEDFVGVSKSKRDADQSEQYELDSVDMEWLYGANEENPEFGLLPSGFVRVSKEQEYGAGHDVSNSRFEEQKGTDAEGGSNFPTRRQAAGEDEEFENVQQAKSPTVYTLGDISWKQASKKEKKKKGLASAMEDKEGASQSSSIEPNKRPSPYLHTEMASATADSLNLVLAEAGQFHGKTADTLTVETEADEVHPAPLEEAPSHITTTDQVASTHGSIDEHTGAGVSSAAAAIEVAGQKSEFSLVSSKAFDITTGLTLAGANLSVLLRASRDIKQLEKEKRALQKPREDFDRVLRELTYRIPVYDEDLPDARIEYNQVLAELRMKVPPFDPDDLQPTAGVKRASVDEQEDISTFKKLARQADTDYEYPLEEVVIKNGDQRKHNVPEYPGVGVLLADGSLVTKQDAYQSNKDKQKAVATDEGLGAEKDVSTKDGLGSDRKARLSGKGDEKTAKEKSSEDDKTTTSKSLSKADKTGTTRSLSENDEAKIGTTKPSSEADKAKTGAKKPSSSEADETNLGAAKPSSKFEKTGTAPSLLEANETKTGATKPSSEADKATKSSSEGNAGKEVSSAAAVEASKSGKKKKKSKKSKVKSDQVASPNEGAEGSSKTAKDEHSMSESAEQSLDSNKAPPVQVFISKSKQTTSGSGEEPLRLEEDSKIKEKSQVPHNKEAVGPGDANDGEAKSQEEKMRAWANARYEQYLASATSSMEKGPEVENSSSLLAATGFTGVDSKPSKQTQEIETLASVTIQDIDIARAVKGDRDEHGRSYDWAFWSRLVDSIRQNPYSDSVQDLKPSVIEHIVNAKYTGVPPEVRKFLWLHLSDNHVPNNMLSGSAYVSDDGKREPIVHNLVSVDAQRTYPKGPEFDEKKKSLRTVLESYVSLDPEVGYCSSLALIGGVLSLELDEEQSLVLLKRMMFHYGLRRQYVQGLEGTRLRVYQFERLLERFRPELAAHLVEIGCPTEEVVGTWFSTVFGYRCPFDLVFQVYDFFLMEGYPALFKTALALYSENEKELMAAKNKDEVTDFFAHHVFDKHGNDYKKWIEVAGCFDISQEYVQDTCKNFTSISQQSQTLGAAEEVLAARSENRQLSRQLRELASQMDSMMLDRERFIRENVDLKIKIMDLMEQNYRLAAALYEERAERARDLAVGEMEVQHLSTLYKHRIEELEKRAEKS